MNDLLRNLNKIEFVVTNACTGRCKHCSEGEHLRSGERIDPLIAAEAVRRIVSEYSIRTVMVFGGEPLLHPEAVYSIICAATELNVPCRQVITNGYFTDDRFKIRKTVQRLSECGVNDLLLSVDAFHQETIPLSAVKAFAYEAMRFSIPIRLSPAWLVSKEDENPYNVKTKELIASFGDMAIKEGKGNVVFPEGNALKYLSEYFENSKPVNPYVEDPTDVRCISFSANGDVLGGNIYVNDVIDIIDNYVV